MTKPNLDTIRKIIEQNLGADCIEEQVDDVLQPHFYVSKNRMVDICLLLKNNEETLFDQLSCITAIDKIEAPRFEVVYHLSSIAFKTLLTLKVKLNDSDNPNLLPEIPSVAHIWKTADWHERETYDLMGIFFSNHPDLRRILMPDDWEGYPLRKDYANAEYYHGIKTN